MLQECLECSGSRTAESHRRPDHNRRDALRKINERKEISMKKLASVFAIAALAAGLVACAQPEQKPAPKTEAPKVIEEKPATAAPGTPSTAAPAPATPSTPSTK
jgi:hypothetical protein